MCSRIAACGSPDARRRGSTRALLAVLLAGCGGDAAVLLEIRGDGLGAGSLDDFCLAVADLEPSGVSFARRYAMDDVGGLPQSLAVDPGDADRGEAWISGDRLGLEVARDRVEFSFDGGEKVLTLAACPGGPGGPPAEVARAGVPMGARPITSLGRGGTLIVAVGQGEIRALRARGGALADAGIDGGAPAGAAAALVAADLDGDCDEDVVVAWRDAPPTILRRDDVGLEAVDALDGAEVFRAVAAADVDGDADVDLALGGETLSLWLNDGTGELTRQVSAITGPDASDVTALAFGDLDEDGAVDLVVGRGRENAVPTRVFLNNGSGVFSVAPGALAEVPFRVRAVSIADLNGDHAPDLLLAAAGSPIKLYANRGDGRLEDRSFIGLPSVEPIDAAALAVGDWDGDCQADAVIALTAGGPPHSWRGGDAGAAMADDGAAGASGTDALFADVDDDGDRDLLMIDGAELVWAAR